MANNTVFYDACGCREPGRDWWNIGHVAMADGILCSAEAELIILD